MIWSYVQHFANVKAQKLQRRAERELAKACVALVSINPHGVRFQSVWLPRNEINEIIDMSRRVGYTPLYIVTRRTKNLK